MLGAWLHTVMYNTWIVVAASAINPLFFVSGFVGGGGNLHVMFMNMCEMVFITKDRCDYHVGIVLVLAHERVVTSLGMHYKLDGFWLPCTCLFPLSLSFQARPGGHPV